MNETPLGKLIDEQFNLRLRKAKITEQLNDVEDQMRNMEERIILTMKAIGTDTGRTENATATLSKRERINIDDFETLINWVLQNPEERIYIFERRLAQGAAKELVELGEEKIPGTDVFSKEVINLRKR